MARPAALFAAAYLTWRTAEILGLDGFVAWHLATGALVVGGIVLYYVLVTYQHWAVEKALKWSIRSMLFFALVGWSWHYGAAPREVQIAALRQTITYLKGDNSDLQAKVSKLEEDLKKAKAPPAPAATPAAAEEPKPAEKTPARKRRAAKSTSDWSLF